MLVLSRRPGETILIGENVVVTICGVSGNHVRIGIKAPADQVILRSEVAVKPVQEGQSDGK